MCNGSTLFFYAFEFIYQINDVAYFDIGLKEAKQVPGVKYVEGHKVRV